jgi:hypothetical protein
MPRYRDGSLTKTGSTVVTFRVPNALLAQIHVLAGSKTHLGEWARALFQAAVAGTAAGVGTLQAQGYEEGKRQGWAHANSVYRAALKVAVEKLK